ncbi:MAG: alpha/beta fold hydrolase [Armatimonadetes bacterium]|nr:alpha/beta fold hydrolase [Armatimonadota bacterium]
MLVAGLWILAAEPMTLTEVTMQGAGIELAGVLTVPSGVTKNAPAILLMPGSGPTDRDGNQPGFTTNLLKDLSEALAGEGYVTLRFDKRPVARYQSVWPKTLPEIGPFFNWDNHIADAKAAAEFLKSRPEVDKKRIAILGHSEGGLFATAIGKDVGAKALLLLGSPGRNMGDILYGQVAAQVSAAPWDDAKKAEFNRRHRQTIDHLTKTGEIHSETPSELLGLYNASAKDLMVGYFRATPLPWVEAFKGPIFIANGESDVQILAKEDATLLEAAAKKNKKRPVSLVIVPEASHNFKLGTPGITGPIAPGLVPPMLEFLKKNL